MLATKDFHRDCSTSAVPIAFVPRRGLVPDCAWLQRDLLRTRDELRIAHTVNQHAAGVGEHHQAIRRPDLLVYMLHDALGVRDQAAVPSHASRNLGVVTTPSSRATAPSDSPPRRHLSHERSTVCSTSSSGLLPRSKNSFLASCRRHWNFQRQQGLSHPDSSMKLLYLFYCFF